MDAQRNSGSPASPSPYLSWVEVENVRCFGPLQRLDLTAPNGAPARWTLILGPNSGGKTTLLQCIAGILPKSRPQYFGESISWVKTDPHLLWYFFKFNKRNPINVEGLVRAKIDSGQLGIGWNDSFDRPYPALELALGIDSIGEQETDVEIKIPVLAYGVGRRAAWPASSNQQDGELGIESLFFDDHNLPSAEEWLLRIDHGVQRRKSSARVQLRRMVVESLVALLPDVEAIQFRDVGHASDPVTVAFKTPFGWMELDELGQGYQTLVTWVVDVARQLFMRFPMLSNPQEAPAIVLVDEIDLHMHPKWQREIMQHLSNCFPNVQFIATAHSPLIVQAADEGTNIAVLRREGDHVIIDNDPERVRNWRVDQILTSDIFELATARPPQVEDAIQRRKQILSKKRKSAKDREELASLEEVIGFLPGSESEQDREAWELVHRAADRLRKQS